jgi:DnaJ-class molecular chaperone|tara:strand:- start:254 stop:460 length:207 start_codon:yes stop_codon:yes gene_type:complete
MKEQKNMDTKTGKRKIFCPKCKGNGFYRIPYHLAKEEVHAQCDDCERTGELWIDDTFTPEELRDKGVI